MISKVLVAKDFGEDVFFTSMTDLVYCNTGDEDFETDLLYQAGWLDVSYQSTKAFEKLVMDS